jgi:DNA-binding MarR family transcriptional regulator
LQFISIAIIAQLMEAEIVAANSDVMRMIRRAFDTRARKIGVTRAQWLVLTQIRRNPGINQGGLAELLDVEPITVGRMIDRLQDGELVERRPDPADRRTWRLHLTDKADALIEQLRPLADDLFEDAFSGLNPSDRATLFNLLDRVRANLSTKQAEGLVANG